MIFNFTIPPWFKPLVSCVFMAWTILVGSWVFRIMNSQESMGIGQQNITLEDKILRELKDAESGQRGFLLTGEMAYIENYYAGAQDVRTDYRTLLVYVHPLDDTQAKRLAELGTLIDAKLAELASTIEVYRSQGFVAALAIVQTNRGLLLMNQIRAILGTLSAEETDRMRRKAMLF